MAGYDLTSVYTTSEDIYVTIVILLLSNVEEE